MHPDTMIAEFPNGMAFFLAHPGQPLPDEAELRTLYGITNHDWIKRFGDADCRPATAEERAAALALRDQANADPESAALKARIAVLEAQAADFEALKARIAALESDSGTGQRRKPS